MAALLILTPASAQYSYGTSGFGPGTFNPVAFFGSATNIGREFPAPGFDPFNPFVYGSVWNPVSFLGPRNIGPASYPANAKNESKGNETESKDNKTTLKSMKALL